MYFSLVNQPRIIVSRPSKPPSKKESPVVMIVHDQSNPPGHKSMLKFCQAQSQFQPQMGLRWSLILICPNHLPPPHLGKYQNSPMHLTGAATNPWIRFESNCNLKIRN